MSMRFTQLISHWDAGEALTVVEFLDTLREALWRSHGEQIGQYLRDDTTSGDEPPPSDFDDAIPF